MGGITQNMGCTKMRNPVIIQPRAPTPIPQHTPSVECSLLKARVSLKEHIHPNVLHEAGPPSEPSLTSPEVDVPSIQCNGFSSPRVHNSDCAPECPRHNPVTNLSAAGRPARQKYAFQSLIAPSASAPLATPVTALAAANNGVCPAEAWGGREGAPCKMNSTALAKKPSRRPTAGAG